MGFFGPNVDRMKAAGDVDGLIQLLSGKQSVKNKAGQALVDIGEPAVGPLIDALGTVGEPAATALAAMGPDWDTFDSVCDVLEGGNQTGQFAAVHTLTLWAMLGHSPSYERLLSAASDHPNVATKTCCGFALQDVADPPFRM